MSRKCCSQSYVKCGRIFQPDLPNMLDPSEPPIVLAEVNVNTKHISKPRVLIKYSEFIDFTLVGLNPKLNIFYRLVREDGCSNYAQILQEWEFEFESSEILEIANVDTNQPTVLNYCDCLDKYTSNKITYRLEIFQIETNSVERLELTNKSFTATVITGGSGERNVGSCCMNSCKSNLPYIKCGKVFNPVLPLNLSKEDNPVVLTRLTIDIESYNTCVLINFSGIVTSVLKDGQFNNLTFRLVRICNDCTREVLKEWPFRRAFVNDTNIKEPVVYNHCECLNSRYKSCSYTFELVEADLSEKSYYNISQKSMTAQVYPGKDQERIISEKGENSCKLVQDLF